MSPFPFLLERVSGILDIQPDHWEFRDFKGSHGTCTFFTRGRSRRDADGEHIEVAIAGRGVRLDDHLREALLKEEMQRIWATFEPEGAVDFDGNLSIVPVEGKDLVPEIALTVVPLRCRVTPKFFKYALSDLQGKVRYEKGTVELEDVTASHGATKVTIDRGIVQLKPGGGFLADLLYLHGNPLVTDPDFIAALPPALQKGVGAIAVEGPVEVRTRCTSTLRQEPGRRASTGTARPRWATISTARRYTPGSSWKTFTGPSPCEAGTTATISTGPQETSM